MTTDKPKKSREAKNFVIMVAVLLIGGYISKSVAGNAGLACFAFGNLVSMVLDEFGL